MAKAIYVRAQTKGNTISEFSINQKGCAILRALSVSKMRSITPLLGQFGAGAVAVGAGFGAGAGGRAVADLFAVDAAPDGTGDIAQCGDADSG